MKLEDTKGPVDPLIEQLEYSEDFASIILEQDTNGHPTTISAKDLLAELDLMIVEAAATDGKATKH